MKCPKCQRVNQDDSRFCAGCGAELSSPSPSPSSNSAQPPTPNGDAARGAANAPGAPVNVSQTLTSPPAARKWIAGQTLAGKYTILGELGKGGMGEVYLAEDTSLDRKVALKFLPEATYRDPGMRARFVREAKAAAALNHPYICNIHEVGEAEGKLFFAMEFLEGKTLRDALHAKTLPSGQALQIAAEIAEALRAAHEKGLIHRDIKPANIMLTPEGHAKVMDFGLAKRFAGPEADTTVGGPTLTATAAAAATGEGLTPGTPAYMSPEQLRGQPLDPRSDVFSLGIVLYEMLTGRHPFKKETGHTTVSAILNEDPQPMAGVVKGLPGGIQRIIGRMLAKDPGDRYASMAEVQADLKEILADVEGAKAKRWFKPARIALTAVILAGAVLGSAWLAKMLFFKTPAKALAFQERDWILITDFENTTGEEVFDAGLETALTVSIQQSQYVNVFPPSRIRETLRRMKREDRTRIDESVGREISLREGIKALLVGGISRVGSEYLLTARLVDPEKQTTVFSDSARAEMGEDILAGIDDLAKKVRRGLGESLAKIESGSMALYKATTSSLEALRYYSASSRAPGDVSVKLLKQAIELDPDFALAHVELGVKYYIGGMRGEGEKHFEKALGLLDRLTSREQLWIRALIEDWRGNREEGIRSYRTYLAQYPDDGAAWFRLGYAYMISSEPEAAIEAFGRVVEIDKDSAGGYVNLASCYNLLDQREAAREQYLKAFSLDPTLETGTYVNNEYGFLMVRMGEIAEAERTFEKMAGLADNRLRTKGLRSLALLRMYQGRYEEAQEKLRESIGLNRALKVGLSEFRDRLYLAIALRRSGQDADFARELAAIENIRKAMKIEPFFLTKLGTLYARAGKVREAEALLEAVSRVVGDILAASGVSRSDAGDQAAYHRLKGEIELARGHYEEALASFEMAGNLREYLVEDSLALAYEKSGNVDKAIEEYLKFLGKDVLGYEAQDVWCVAHYVLGRLYEKKGDAAEAAQWYGRFKELWKDADEGLLGFSK
jgi:tetratricopeptide (TPR) repeat protein/tRNA A-37 threonylcarbamoyl transferase component Bud32